MKNETIIYMGGFALPDKNAAAHRVLNNAKALQRLGFNIVFSGVTSSQTKRKYQKINGFSDYSRKYPKDIKSWFKFMISTKEFKYILKEHPETSTVILYNYPSLAQYRIMKLAKRNQLKVISDCTEWYGFQGHNILWKMLKGIDSFILMRILNKRVNGIIVISKFLKEYYKKQHTVLIPPLVDKEEVKWHAPNFKYKTTLSVIYFGSPGIKKDNIYQIVKYLSKDILNDKVELDIVGIDRKQGEKRLEKSTKLQQELLNKIKFHGRKNHLESIELLKQSDLSIFFREENRVTKAGFPTKLVESISAKVPIISNYNSNINDYIINGFNGYLISDFNKVSHFSESNMEDIVKMKDNIDDFVFDYRRYISSFDDFINNMK